MKDIKTLYNENEILLVGNAWDAMSALIMEQQGYKIIGTTSWGVANSLGYCDGERIAFERYLQTLKDMLNVISVPLSVDVESGFSEDHREIAANVLEIAKLGCAGINIEDSTKNYTLKDVCEFTELLKTLKDVLGKSGYSDFHINARSDTYIALKEGQLEETVSRVQAYESAGADGIFIPLLSKESDIATIVKSVSIPLNIMSLPSLTEIDRLKALGVRRFSFGNAMSDHVVSEIERLSKAMLETGNTACLYEHGGIKTKFH